MQQLVIVNPIAGGFHIEEFIKEIKQEFNKRNLSYEIIRTNYPMHAYEIVKSLKDASRIYACGGDGTLREVINGMVNTNHELVVIPCGTGNDFSRMLKDGNSYRDCFYHSFDREYQLIDVLKINDTYCINAACFGLDADIAEHVHDLAHIKWIPKSCRYNLAVLRRIFLYKCNDVEVYRDNEPVYIGKIMMMACNNAKYYGNGFSITPNSNVTESEMHVCIIKAFPRWKILYKCIAVFKKQPDRLKETLSFKCKNLKVKSRTGINIDGEVMEGTTFDFTVVPSSIRLINPLK